MKFFVVAIGLMLLLNCNCNTPNYTSTPSTVFTAFEDELFLEYRFGYNIRALEWQISGSEFSIIGTLAVTNRKQINKHKAWMIDGEVKINSIIYGEFPGKTIPISAEYQSAYRAHHSGSDFGEGVYFGPFSYLDKEPKDGDTIILLCRYYVPQVVKGDSKPTQDKRLNIIRAIIRDDVNAAAETYKTIKELENLNKYNQKDFQKERKRLLNESNNIELLFYLCKRSLVIEQRLENVLWEIQVLFDRRKKTPGCGFLAYDFATVLLKTHNDELTQDQREKLAHITLQTLSEIKTIEDGIKYLDVVSFSFASLDKIPNLKKDMLQMITNLSKQFKNDKSYPEWEKWVNKIFPPASPSGGPEEKTEK